MIKLKSPKKSYNAEKNLDDLHKAISKYFPDADTTLIDKAYKLATEKHKDQVRKSGEPYYIHPLEVAKTLADLKMDIPTIIASLLHDIVEDTDVKLKDIEKEFGSVVRQLVNGVTKLSKYKFKSTEEAQAENFRKMIIAMAKDIRVIIIKLADRLHNMRTLKYLPIEKRQRIAQETLDIYAPVANRLGISWIKIALEDLSFMYLEAEEYSSLAGKVQKKKTEKEKYIQEVIEIMQDRLSDFQIKGDVSGRLKNYYSIANKMKVRDLEFEQIYDLIAFRITVDDVSQCYEVLGIIHSFWKPVPGRFKDYIAMPKPNNYQSLHTTVIGPYGERVEIQIRTQEMHQIAEQGIAAHWMYKEGHMSEEDAQKFTWLASLLEAQQDISAPSEFLDSVKLDLFAGEVYVFTPTGEVKELPIGSTPIDFAYSIHTDVGHKCVGAKVNETIVPLKYSLKSGDTVEILTSKTQMPKKDWLRYAKTSRAKTKIRHYLKTVEKERSRQFGHEILEKEMKKHSMSYQSLNKSGKISEAAAALKYRSIENLLVAIAYGRVTPKQVLKTIVPDIHEKETKPSILEEIIQRAAKSVRSGRTAVKVKGIDDILVRFAKCCTPIPGESIIGFITRGRGITVHRKNCSKVFEVDEERLIDVEWDKNVPATRVVRIRLEAFDIAGLLAKMTKVFAENNAGVVSADIKTTSTQRAVCHFDISIKNIEQLTKILTNLKKLDGVLHVGRVSMVPGQKDNF